MRIRSLRRDRLFAHAARHPAAEAALESFAAVDAAPVIAAAAEAAAADPSLHDPPLEPRDEAVFLLFAISEVEHALMVQYLYAAYSLREAGQSPEHGPLVTTWRDVLLQIAREEMAHLATVQNLLLVLGAPLHLDREHSPLASQLYPFRFKLQPLTLRSLAKYVAAERPQVKPPDLAQTEWDFITGELEHQAQVDNDGRPLQQVGGLFKRLRTLFETIPDEQFRLDTHAFQAHFADWGYDPEAPSVGERLIVESFPENTPAAIRAATLRAIDAIALQGEGFDLPPAGSDGESHFERFYQVLYKGWRDSQQGGEWEPTWPVAVNPNTSRAPVDEAPRGDMSEMIARSMEESGRITNERSRAWAQLFNLRYRLLLGCLAHFLHSDEPPYVTATDSTRGDRSARGWLLIWTFYEMSRLKKLAGKLVQLPLTDAPDDPRRAGPTFELPYTTTLPQREADRWRAHADTLRAAQNLVARLRQSAPDANDPFLQRLSERDEASHAMAQRLAAGGGLPPAPEKFQKFVLILEEAVRGFTIGKHGNFWRDKRWSELIGVDLPSPLRVIIDPVADPATPRNARIVQRIAAPTRWMPLKRPRIPAERIEAIVDWIAAGCPDNDPPNAIALVSEGVPLDEPAAPPVPPPPGTLGFAADIQPLFRPFDRSSMLFLFDLHRYEDVRDHADEILAAVRSGGMPCDGAWPAERIETFAAWVEQGRNP